MLKEAEVFVITFLILLSSTVESTKPIKKVLSLVREIKKQMVTVDEITEIKNQLDAIDHTIATSCSCSWIKMPSITVKFLTHLQGLGQSIPLGIHFPLDMSMLLGCQALAYF